MTEIERAIQEFEDEAFHHSLHPEISNTSKAVALAVLREKQEREKSAPLTLDELVEAEREGRCVVLPCKIRDTLFVLTSDSLTGIEESRCKRIVVVNREEGPCAKIIAPCVFDDWGGTFREFFPEDFGKIVFLTRKEAEAAKRGGGDG